MVKFVSVIIAFALLSVTARAETLLVEAESFDDHGGWSLDTAFIQIVGSPVFAGPWSGATGG